MKKTAVITGSSRGIGASTALEFAHRGYNVVINYNNSKDKADNLLKEIKSFGGSAIAVKANVSKYEEGEFLCKRALEEFARIDVLVNNAGIAHQKLFTKITEQEWNNMFDVNIHGMFNCTRPIADHMIKNHNGKIINISSMWGVSGGSCEVHYSASKAAVIGFTKALAKELGPSNICVNCVAPGVIKTDMNSLLSDDDLKSLIDETPCSRLGTPEDVSKAVLFLASSDSNFITGQVICVDGGILL